MTPLRFALLALPAFALAGCDSIGFGGKAEAPATIPVGEGFSVTTVEWEGTESVTKLAWAVRDNNGQAEICGAAATEGDDAAVLAQEAGVLANSRISAGDTAIAQNLNFFARGSGVAQGAPANCQMTGTAWNPAYAEKPPVLTLDRTAL